VGLPDDDGGSVDEGRMKSYAVAQRYAERVLRKMMKENELSLGTAVPSGQERPPSTPSGFCECYVMDGQPKFQPRRSWICEDTRETPTGNVRTLHCRSCLRTWKTRAFYATEVHER
jgi:hypothetical protein